MRSRTPDRLCAEAIDRARAAAEEAAGAEAVGEHLGVEADGDRVVTHSFACKEPAYRGWRWAVTLARASRSKTVTVDETVLLPGNDALLAPEWVPWSERLRPGDLGPGDLLPTDADDPRLEPGWMAGEELSVGATVSPETTAPTGDDPVVDTAVTPAVATISAFAERLGLARARVLSRYGLHTAAERWEERFGGQTPTAQAAPAQCSTCGFLMPITGSLRQAFGVCANEYAPADGRVVSLSFGCGAHSEAAVMPRPTKSAEPVLDETQDLEPLPLHRDGLGGSGQGATSTEDARPN